MVSYEEQVAFEDELSLSHPDPVVLELNRLQNLLKGFSLLLKHTHTHFLCVSAMHDIN